MKTVIPQAYNREHANQLCELTCEGHVNKQCQDRHHVHCWTWTLIDPFKRLFLETKYKRKE